jgi:hypothetical protein
MPVLTDAQWAKFEVAIATVKLRCRARRMSLSARIHFRQRGGLSTLSRTTSPQSAQIAFQQWIADQKA